MLVKLASFDIAQSDMESEKSALADPEILERFRKFAADLKIIAPLANSFLYFSCVMMSSAESSVLDKDGELKKDASGKPLEANWEINDKTGSLKWVCSDSNVRPYKNANGDIFPEEELIKAHKKWVGKPLCLDHKSSSVEFVRGLIVDTYYDRKHKRVIALCALDKQNYPALARQVATGYSASVSMGTAVGRAICYDCGRVARVESDFCSHMQNKSCYGEINCDLSPMELSIVVNGADPAAKIKHIIAKDLSKAADSLQNYMNTKISQGGVTQEELSGIQNDLQGLTERVTKLVEASSVDKDSNDTNYGTTQSTQAMAESGEESSATPAPNLPEKIISVAQTDWGSEINELRTKISTLQENLNKRLIVLNDKEPTMANSIQEKTAYYQGTVEPTPGKPQYEKDPTNQTVRETQDKQMVGHSPFPGVGPVDGMYPGISESDEVLKKRLQRLADVKERQIRRQAALEKAKEQISEKKEAYFQGGGGANEPTPGKPKYPEMTVDGKGYKEIWDEDKHMVGQKPFPDVGSITGLHPSPASADQKDELKRKEMLARAKLSAKFVKAITAEGQADLGRSRWDVYAGKDLILSATVNDITSGNATDVLYNSIATEKFGTDVLRKIKSEGFEATKSALIKSAQGAPPAPASIPGGLAADNAPAAEMPAMPDMGEDVGGGSPKDQVDAALDATEEGLSDLKEAVDAMKGESTELESVPPATEGDFAGAEAGGLATAASVSTLQSMRKTLNGMLTTAMVEAFGNLKSHAEELKMASEIYKNKFASFQPSQRKYLDSLAIDAVVDAKRTLADVAKLKGAFVKYAHGTDGLIKRAQGAGMEGTDQAVKPGETAGAPADSYDPIFKKELGHSLPEHSTAVSPVTPTSGVHSFDPSAQTPLPPLLHTDAPPPAGSARVDLDNASDMKVTVPAGADASKLPTGSVVTAEFDLSTKEGRAAYRMKLAQKGVDWNEMVGKAHPKGNHIPSGLGGAADKHDVVENIAEIHDAVYNLANMPVKVKKQAEAIAKLVSEGKLDAADVDQLVAQGVDAEAVKYWKQFWSEAKDSDSKDFANKLVQDYGQKKMAEEVQKQEVRIKRAYDLAYEMRDRGIIDQNQLKSQVDEILQWNDEAFESTKRIIAKQAIKKQAMPQVGLLHSSDVILPAAEAAQTQEHTDLVSVFSGMFANRKF